MTIFSVAFKSTTRDNNPCWSNRIRKQVNDLMYNVKQVKDIEFIKKSSKTIDGVNKIQKHNKKHNKKLQNRGGLSSTNKRLLSPFKNKFDLGHNTSQLKKRSESMKILAFSQTNFRKAVNPETYFSSSSIKQKICFNGNKQIQKIKAIQTSRFKDQKKKNSNVQTLGLSDFQFNLKTIQGRILSKRGYNIDLDKCKTQKINSVKESYYKQEHVKSFQQLQKSQELNQRKQLMKYRNFSQYSPHSIHSKKIVGEGGSLDKFYDHSNEQYNLLKPTSRKFNLGKMSPRRQPPLKLGTQLQYKSYTELSKANKGLPLFLISQSQRKLVIGKQVISPQRGCFR